MSIIGTVLAFLFAPAFKPEVQPETKPVAKKKITPDLPGLIAWLETQDPTTTYDPMSPTDCLMCRFAGAVQGRKHPVNFLAALETIKRDQSGISMAAYRGANNYGAALDRAHTYMRRNACTYMRRNA